MEIEHRIVSCDQLNLLELGQMLPWENSIKMQFKMWNRYYSDGTIRRLMNYVTLYGKSGFLSPVTYLLLNLRRKDAKKDMPH